VGNGANRINFFILLGLVISLTIQDSAYAEFETKDLVVTVKDIKMLKLDNIDVVRIKINVLNNGSDEASFFEGNFELLDSQLRKFGSVSAYELEEKGESVSRGICDVLFGNSINPGLSMDLEVCFDVPKTNFQYDSLIIYQNMFIRSIDDAQIVPLVENSIGYKALVEKSKLQNEELATRAEEIESEGGCLIATAAYGTELAPEVQNLREIRNQMYETELGGDLMKTVNDFYYSFSPTVADWERENSAFKETVKLVITPALTSFMILDHNSIDTEESLIWYVFSVVLLNVGMYFVLPALVIHRVRKFV